ncbi:MAG: glycosyltransferase involved in cell wall biosynthesis, partial [Bacteroidia bacterium]
MNDNSKISAIIITFNEQEHIGACIRSLQGVVDEVLVVDSHSTDDTVSISESLGAKVISAKWQGYADTKNVGNQNATYNTILSIDADEELSEDLRASILTRKSIGFSIEHVYKFNRLNNYCGQWIKYAGWYPDTK